MYQMIQFLKIIRLVGGGGNSPLLPDIKQVTDKQIKKFFQNLKKSDEEKMLNKMTQETLEQIKQERDSTNTKKFDGLS